MNEKEVLTEKEQRERIKGLFEAWKYITEEIVKLDNSQAPYFLLGCLQGIIKREEDKIKERGKNE